MTCTHPTSLQLGCPDLLCYAYTILPIAMDELQTRSKRICWLCYKVAAPSLAGVLRHMAAVHAYDPQFFICWGVDGCTRTYQNFFSFKRNMYRKHRGSLDLKDKETGGVENSVVERISSECDSASELVNEDVVDLGNEPDTPTGFPANEENRFVSTSC